METPSQTISNTLPARSGRSMNKLLRILLHIIYSLGLLLILIFSGSKYGGISGTDPSISASDIEDISGNRTVFLGVVLAVVIAAELILAIKARKTTERLVPGLLVLVAILAFVSR